MGVQDGKYKIVKAGTPFPSDNSNAVGIVFEDIDNANTEGSYADVSTEYPLTKSGNTQTGWSTAKGGEAVSKVEMTGNVTLYPVWTTA